MRRLLTPRWLVLHVTAVVLVVVFLRLGWWQLGRGEAGNTLSWGYTAEWPFFALCVLFMWYKMAEHELYPEGRPSRRERKQPDEAGTEAEPGAKPDTAPTPASDGSAGPHTDPVTPATAPRLPPKRVVPTYAPDDEDDPELAAYNDYLSQLNARSH